VSRFMRTIVIWVVLIILFFGFYAFFAAHPSAEPSPRTDDVSLWQAIVTQFLPIMVLFTVFVVFMRRLRRQSLPATVGVTLLSQGRYAEALAQFEQDRSTNPKDTVGVFNTGVAKLSLWKLEADLQAAEQMAGGKRPVLETLLPEHLALAFALVGDEAAARQRLATIASGKGDPGRIALAEAILLTRAGNPSEARRRLGSFESKQLGGTMGALARVVDAMCVESLTGELRHVDRVALFGEGGPDELRKAWPDFVAFIERAPAA